MGALIWIAILGIGGVLAYKFWSDSETKKFTTRYKNDPAYKKKVDGFINQIGTELKKSTASSKYSKISYT